MLEKKKVLTMLRYLGDNTYRIRIYKVPEGVESIMKREYMYITYHKTEDIYKYEAHDENYHRGGSEHEIRGLITNEIGDNYLDDFIIVLEKACIEKADREIKRKARRAELSEHGLYWMFTN